VRVIDESLVEIGRQSWVKEKVFPVGIAAVMKNDGGILFLAGIHRPGLTARN